MPTDKELRDQAVAQLKATTISYPSWQTKVAQDRYTPRDGSGTAFGKAFAALAAIGGGVEPPPPPPPPPPTGGAFQAAWDATKAPTRPSGARTVVVTSYSALLSAWQNRQTNDLIQARGVVWSGRLELRSSTTPVWIDFDSACQLTDSRPSTKLYGQGLWPVYVENLYITGFLKIRRCTAQGMLLNGSKNSYYELDIADCDGTGILADTGLGSNSTSGAAASCVNNTIKARLTNNGLGALPSSPTYYPECDPHAQKGTGAHGINVWDQAGGRFVIDGLNQTVGALFESTNMRTSKLWIRGKNISGDVSVMPAGPGGERQAAGSLWQPWGYNHIGNEVYVEAVGCSNAVEPSNYGGSSGNIVRQGPVSNARLSPIWPFASWIAYQSASGAMAAATNDGDVMTVAEQLADMTARGLIAD